MNDHTPRNHRLFSLFAVLICIVITLIFTKTCKTADAKQITTSNASKSQSSQLLLLLTTDLSGEILLAKNDPFLYQTRLVLRGSQSEHVAPVRIDGSFRFKNIHPDTYTLTFDHRTHHFQPILVQVTTSKLDIPSSSSSKLALRISGLMKHDVYSSLALYPSSIQPIVYFHSHEEFSIVQMVLKNPMLLFFGFGMIMMIFMPKLMNSMSEEEKADMNSLTNSFSMQGIMKNLESKTKQLQQADTTPNTQSQIKSNKSKR